MNTRAVVKRLGAGLVGLAVVGAGLVVGAQLSPAFGAAVADAVRAVAGPGLVAWVEDVSYDAADRVKRVVYQDAAPKQFWDEAAATSEPLMSVEPPHTSTAPEPFAPPFPKVAGKTDGTWVALAQASPGDPIFYRTVVHPDDKRTFAAVAIVAVDRTQVDLSLVAGTVEPVSTLPAEPPRPGLVPVSARPALLAAFNGGFKAEHGHYGAMVDGVVLLPSRERACTISILDDGVVKVGPTVDPELAGRVRSARQTPPCLVVNGEIDERTSVDGAQRWGAAVGGATVIRRSALGVSADGERLFYGLGDSVTAGALARAMKAAGAVDVAQLDVNAAYPRFLLYAQADGQPVVREGLIPGLAYGPQEYVRAPEPRDFFYLTRRGAPAPEVAACVAPEPSTALASNTASPTTQPARKKGCKKGKCRRSEVPAELDAAAV